MTGAELLIGSTEAGLDYGIDIKYRQLKGDITHIAIYDGATTHEQSHTIETDMMSI